MLRQGVSGEPVRADDVSVRAQVCKIWSAPSMRLWSPWEEAGTCRRLPDTTTSRRRGRGGTPRPTRCRHRPMRPLTVNANRCRGYRDRLPDTPPPNRDGLSTRRLRGPRHAARRARVVLIVSGRWAPSGGDRRRVTGAEPHGRSTRRTAPPRSRNTVRSTARRVGDAWAPLWGLLTSSPTGAALIPRSRPTLAWLRKYARGMPTLPTPHRFGERIPADRADRRSVESTKVPVMPRPIAAPSRSVRRQLLVAKVTLIVFGCALLILLAVAISGALR
jgi:hypothetical protein